MFAGSNAVQLPRWKALAVLLLGAACWVSAAPALAKADPYLTITSGGEPATIADFGSGGSLGILGNGGTWACQEFALRTEITENAADPVLLELLEDTMHECYLPNQAETPIEYELEFTAPMSLNVDGTGEIPLRVEEKSWFGKCVISGTLDVTWYESGELNLEGVMKAEYGGTCINTTALWIATLGPPTDQEGEPMEGFFVTP